MTNGGGGKFITFEGIEGSGKSTHARMLFEELEKRGITALLTAEPGGTKIGARIREVLLAPEHVEMDRVAELLLYNASRAQLVNQVILPSVEQGTVVISDRFSDSTVAYQGYGRGIELPIIYALDEIAAGGLRPDLTLLLDLPVEEGLARNKKANKTDRLELEEVRFHEKVRQGYLKLRDGHPNRITLVSASGRTKEDIHAEVLGKVLLLLKK